MLLSERILQGARVMAGLSQAELAEAAGIGTSVLADIERGAADPRNSTLVRLAEVLAEHGVQLVGLSQGVLGGALLLDKRSAQLDQAPIRSADNPRLPLAKARPSRAIKKAP